ncbi:MULTISPECIES: serpin family protein [unclassified Nocardia]|uniref:serpin family protein n=1 Tax=unclassified Nocardia TaxID=2637762 RepID=UPI001CE49DF9|nr:MULTISPECIES: serpin family protein [unclassified Nocardia]
MGTSLKQQVGAANELTARWCAAAGEADFVLSGAGVWPLLALLAAAADGPARAELAAAAGIPADTAQAAAVQLIGILDDAVDIAGALGIWVRKKLPLHDDWVAEQPKGTIDLLTDQAALDSWAAQHTGGLIEKFPLQLDPATVLVLATALVAKTKWRKPFEEILLIPEHGPWQGARISGLYRSTDDIDAAAILDGPTPVTRVIVTGTADLDVHLLVGDGDPGIVLRTGLGALTGAVPVNTELPPGTTGPGLRVTTIESTDRHDRLGIRLPSFDIRSFHNLLALPDVFGLRAATDTTRGHFPRISPAPLAVNQAAQDVLARFTREGFESAAVTAMGMVLAGMARPTHTVRAASVEFDRPFGFLAVHRPSGLAVTAGWVATPTPAPPPRSGGAPGEFGRVFR